MAVGFDATSRPALQPCSVLGAALVAHPAVLLGLQGFFFVFFLFLFCRGSQGAPTGVVPGGEEMKDGPVESVLPSSPAGTQRRNFVPIAPLTVNGTPRTSRAHSLLY